MAEADWKRDALDELRMITIGGTVLAFCSLLVKALGIHSMDVMCIIIIAILFTNVLWNNDHENYRLTRFVADVFVIAGAFIISLFMGMMGVKIGDNISSLLWQSKIIITEISAFAVYALLRISWCPLDTTVSIFSKDGSVKWEDDTT